MKKRSSRGGKGMQGFNMSLKRIEITALIIIALVLISPLFTSALSNVRDPLSGMSEDIAACLTPSPSASSGETQAACKRLLTSLIALIVRLTPGPDTHAIKVITPGGGERYDVGDTLSVGYSLKGISYGPDNPILIYLQKGYEPGSPKEGINSSMLIGSFFGAVNEKDEAFFNYEILPNITSWPGFGNNYSVKVCANGCAISAQSALFSIGSAHSSEITVTAPNGGEEWEIGQLNTITWAPYGYNPDMNPASDIDVILVVEYGDKIGRIMDTGKASLHTYFNIDTYDEWAEPGRYYVDVINEKTGERDRSDAPFTLLPRAVDLKVNGSDDSVTLAYGEQVELSLEVTPNVSTCTVAGVRAKDGGPVQIGPPINSSPLVVQAFFDVDLPSNSSTAIYADCTLQNGQHRSDSVGVFGSRKVEASVKVISPNGGDVIDPNKDWKITTHIKGIKTFSLALYKNDTFLVWLFKDISTAGQPDDFDWMHGHTPIAQMFPEYANGAPPIFKIYATGLKADGTGYVDDKSDKPFALTSRIDPPPPSTNPAISAWPTSVPYLGTTYVTWSSSGFSECNIYVIDSATGKQSSWNDGLEASSVPAGGLTSDTTFKIRCDRGAAEQSVTVRVAPQELLQADQQLNVANALSALEAGLKTLINVINSQ